MIQTNKYTSRGRVRIIVKVVMSSTTRVPEVSFSLSTLLRQPTTYRGPLLAFTMTWRNRCFGCLVFVVLQGQKEQQKLIDKSEGKVTTPKPMLTKYSSKYQENTFYLQRSLSRGRRTSPIIWPTLCSDFKSSSVLAKSFFAFFRLSLTACKSKNKSS